MRIIILAFWLVLSSGSMVVFAADNKHAADKLSETEQKHLDELKAYLTKIAPEVAKEIASFREKRSALAAEGRKLYGTLSDEAKKALKEEKEYRKKLSHKALKAFYKHHHQEEVGTEADDKK